MTGPQAAASLSGQQMASRRASLRQANLATLIVLIVQYGLGMGVNLYVTLPPASTPGRGSQAFSNGPVLAIHTVLGVLLVFSAGVLLVRAIMARHVPVIVTSAVGLVAIITAAINGFIFARNVTAASSLGMAIATAVALACYAVGLFVAPTPRRDVITPPGSRACACPTRALLPHSSSSSTLP